MRLLKQVQPDRTNAFSHFSLTNFLPANISSVYAILSHRWGPDEVTLKDLESGAAQTKRGYRKLQFCAEQAARDGIVYFWIDTCCIDKANSTEFSEAINSMFKWYRCATKCYVYLEDVSTMDDGKAVSDKQSWAPAFQASKWFTRGWTLQELLAPRIVEFFSVKGDWLGNKTSLEQQLHNITGIPIGALQGSSLTEFDVEERFFWAAGRETTVEEDAAYCLLGIFDIQMALLYGEGKQKAVARLRRKIEKQSRSVSFKAVTAPWVVPFEKNPRFIGRETELTRLEKQLVAQDHTCKWAVVGLGGVGKTQLVLELLHRTRIKYPDCTVMWIPATSRESLLQGFSIVAQQLNIAGHERKDTNIVTLVRDHLSNVDMGQWILVFDNADDIDLWINNIVSQSQEPSSQSAKEASRLMDQLPQHRRGCIVFTTRDKKVATKLAGPNIVPLFEMSEEAAMRLLGKYLGDIVLVQQQDAVRLLAELTYLPLAIVQAASYIIANSVTLAEYLLLLGEKEEEVIELLSEDFEDHGRYKDTKNPVATTWLVSFEQIQKLDQVAAEYLSLMACIHPKGIPRSFLPPAASRLVEMKSIGTLTSYSFTTKHLTEDTFDLHRLVQLATRSWLRKEGVFGLWQERAMIRLAEVLPKVRKHENKDEWRKYLPHFLHLFGSDDYIGELKQTVNLVVWCGSSLHDDGRWNDAEKLFVQALRWYKVDQSKNDLLILKLKGWLAATYRSQGRLMESQKLIAQVLETSKAKLGVDHPETLHHMSVLASIYREQGRLEEASELQLQALEELKTVAMADHPKILQGTNNLALIYLLQGRLEEAERIQTHSVEICHIKLGPDHSTTINSMKYLTETYRRQGRLNEAEKLHLQVLDMSSTKLGVDHPYVLTSMTSLAQTYRQHGRLNEAEKLLSRALEKHRRRSGSVRLDTLDTMLRLADTWKELGQDAQAFSLLTECIQDTKRTVGVDHAAYVFATNLLREWESQRAQERVGGVAEIPDDRR